MSTRVSPKSVRSSPGVGRVILGLRDRLGVVHRRRAMQRTVIILRRGQPSELAAEQMLNRGDRFQHRDLGMVVVTGRATE